MGIEWLPMETRAFIPPPGFVDLLLDAVCVVDRDGRFLFASAACERIFGYRPDEMVGTLMIDMVRPRTARVPWQRQGRS